MDAAHGGVLRGALFMGAAFGLGAAVPVLPFLFLPISAALPAAVVLTGAVLFGVGVIKTRWTQRSPIASGLEVLALAAIAGVAGYLFGTLLPQLLGRRRHRRLTSLRRPSAQGPPVPGHRGGQRLARDARPRRSSTASGGPVCGSTQIACSGSV